MYSCPAPREQLMGAGTFLCRSRCPLPRLNPYNGRHTGGRGVEIEYFLLVFFIFLFCTVTTNYLMLLCCCEESVFAAMPLLPPSYACAPSLPLRAAGWHTTASLFELDDLGCSFSILFFIFNHLV